MWILSAAGYVTPGIDGLSAGQQPESAINCLWMMMSFVPAMVAALSVLIVWFYPLTTTRVEQIVSQLKAQRAIK
jgi:GPH family glycoside/pentoside/hexuronide:cation symporter